MAFSGLTSNYQVAAIYVGYFGRAADPAGIDYWLNTDYQRMYAENLANGQSTQDANMNALITIATSFSKDTEAKGVYSFLATPETGDTGAFVDSVYTNLFGHTADAAGKAYWVGELEAHLADTFSVGKFILQVMNGAGTLAEGNPLYQQSQDDLGTMTNRAEVSGYYAERAKVHGSKWTQADARSVLDGITQNDTTVETARTAVNDVFDDDGTVVQSADTGTLPSAVQLDAAASSFKFTDDATVLNNVVISNFTSDDVIEVSNAVDGDYQFTNNGADVIITYNHSGTMNMITLSGVVTANDIVDGSEASFESAIGFDAFTFA